MAQEKHKTEFGDFQTPHQLAERCCEVVKNQFDAPSFVIEPTCGKGAFLIAAKKIFPTATLYGFEINDQYRRDARRELKRIDNKNWNVRKSDFFSTDWRRERGKLDGAVLYLGNPPWVTNSQLGTLSSKNLPGKTNVLGDRGIDAMTGRSNFDISESILQTLLDSMKPDVDVMAMLIKRATARKLMSREWASGRFFSHVSLHPIDAKQEFNASVDACLMLAQRTDNSATRQICRESKSLGKPARRSALGWFGERIVPDPVAAKATSHLVGKANTLWRSGVKHDLSRVMELVKEGDSLQTQLGESVNLEAALVYPLAKGADIANGRTECPRRRILITQRTMAENSNRIADEFPDAWDYLQSNRVAFASRKSSIYKNRDPFALFGIGEYTFAKWKVAICGLYKRLTFSVVGPVEGKPVILDDTCYFLPLQTRRQATLVSELLQSELAAKYFNARIFWDAKRPITAEVLRGLNLRMLAHAEGRATEYDACFSAKKPANAKTAAKSRDRSTSRKRRRQTI